MSTFDTAVGSWLVDDHALEPDAFATACGFDVDLNDEVERLRARTRCVG